MPSSYEELEDVIDRIMKHKVTIDRYRYDDHVIVALLHSVAISNKRIVELHTYWKMHKLLQTYKQDKSL